MRLPAKLAAKVQKPLVVDGQRLDPNLQLLFWAQRFAKHGGFETFGGPFGARREYRRIIHMLERGGWDEVTSLDRTIDTATRSVPVRIYTPPTSSNLRSAVIYFHGGGFVLGDLDTHDVFCRRICQDADTIVISVDYRLAPEHPFPAAIEDCMGVARRIQKDARAFGIDPERIALAGDSAGANLAAVTSTHVSGFCAQFLIYPAIDATLMTESKILFRRDFGLEQSTLDWFIFLYAGYENRRRADLSPYYASNLEDSPSTHIVVAGYDILRDEGIAFANRLREAGVSTSIRVFSSLAHGFIHFTQNAACDAAVTAIVQELRSRLEKKAPSHLRLVHTDTSSSRGVKRSGVQRRRVMG